MQYPFKRTRVCVVTSALSSAMTTPVEKQPQLSDIRIYVIPCFRDTPILPAQSFWKK